MKKMLIETNIRVKAYEIDSMGIVNNIHYVKWFEDIRHKYLDKYYPYGEMMSTGVSPMLMKTEVEYKRPITIQDSVKGICWVENIEKMRWEFHFEISVDGKLCCKGLQKGCFWDLNKNRPTFVPNRIRTEYERQNALC